tara:strand:- start:694 stop:852 length:159 start_codon:yes stop_codon:yes gene_type:complete
MTPQMSALIALKTFKIAKRFKFLLALGELKVTQADKHRVYLPNFIQKIELND